MEYSLVYVSSFYQISLDKETKRSQEYSIPFLCASIKEPAKTESPHTPCFQTCPTEPSLLKSPPVCLWTLFDRGVTESSRTFWTVLAHSQSIVSTHNITNGRSPTHRRSPSLRQTPYWHECHHCSRQHSTKIKKNK